MSNINKRFTPRETSKWLFFYECKLVALAYAISLIPLPLKTAHVVAVEGFVLWSIISAIYTVWYRTRHRNVPEAVEREAGLRGPSGSGSLKRNPIRLFRAPLIRPHHVGFLGSGKEPPSRN